MSEALLYLLLIFSPLAHGAVEVWSVAFLHVLTISIAALFAITMIRKGHLFLYKTPMDRPVLFMISFVFISLLMSFYPYASRIQIYKIINYTVIFYFLVNVFRTRRQMLRLIYVLVIFGSLFSVAGLIYISGSLPVLKILSFTKLNVSFTFVNYNHFAGYLEMIAFLCLGLALAHDGAKRSLLLALCIFISIAVIFSLSRGGILGLFSGLVFFLIIGILSREKWKTLWLMMLFILIILFVISLLGLEPVITRLETLNDPLAAGKDRLKIWADVLKMIRDNFWFGTGTGTFRYAFPRYLSGVTQSYLNHAHNDYLELMAEMGIVGIVVFIYGAIVLFATVLRNLFTFKNSRLHSVGIGALSGCFALLVHGMTDFNFHIPSNAILFTVCMAIAVNCLIADKELYSCNKLMLIDFKLPKSWRLPAYLLVCIGSMASFVLVISPYLGESYLREARRLQMSKDYESAFIAMNKALFIDPGNAANMAYMGDLLVARSSNSGSNSEREMYMINSLKYYNDAINACPVISNYYSNKGFVLNQLGRNDEAEEAFINAVDFAPMNSFARYSLGYYYLKQGSFEKAYEAYSTLIRLDSGFLRKVLDNIWSVSPTYDNLKQVVPVIPALRNEFANFLFSKGEQEAALDELRLAFSLEPSAKNAVAYLNGLVRVNKWDIAMKAGEGYLLQFGHDVPLLKQMALLYEKLDNTYKAISIYRHLIADNPEDFSIYLSFAGFYRNRGQYSEAISVMAEAIQHMPEKESLYYALDELYYAVHKNKEAINSLEALLQYRPDDAEIYYRIASNYKELRMTEKALEYMRLAIFQQPENAHYRYTLGGWYRQLGLYQLAVEQLEKCLDINAEHKGCKRVAGEIYDEVGISK